MALASAIRSLIAMGAKGADFQPTRIHTAADVYALVGDCVSGALHAVHVDGDGRVLGVSEGEAMAEPRQMMRDAVSLGSAAVIVAHLSDAEPRCPAEQQQLAACATLVEASRSLGIKLLDYLLFGPEDFCSFRQCGLL